ncbi:hypothetical protein R1sor_009192 [Riccia sorocarpa]|uniref:Uncharacterized protein n=1 Tax=Riccia sorocarpa TaxID=122646 RepID=A0ABD3H5N0_9MARC
MDEENNLSGNERCSPDGDLAGRIKERLTHLELDNKYLEARMKLLENDGRNYRLKIDELRAELRERTETLVACSVRISSVAAKKTVLSASGVRWQTIPLPGLQIVPGHVRLQFT